MYYSILLCSALHYFTLIYSSKHWSALSYSVYITVTMKIMPGTVYSTHSTVYSIHITVYIHTVKCTVYTLKCTLHIVHWILHTVLCTLYNTLYTVDCTVQTVTCTVHTAQCTVYTVPCKVHSAHCTVDTVHCTVDTVQWQLCREYDWISSGEYGLGGQKKLKGISQLSNLFSSLLSRVKIPEIGIECQQLRIRVKHKESLNSSQESWVNSQKSWISSHGLWVKHQESRVKQGLQIKRYDPEPRFLDLVNLFFWSTFSLYQPLGRFSL